LIEPSPRPRRPGPFRRAALSGGLIWLLAACAAPGLPEPERKPDADAPLRIEAVTFADLPGWRGDRPGAALAPFLKSCAKLKALPANRQLAAGEAFGRVGDWLPICASAALIRPGNDTEARYFFESRFRPYRAVGSGLFTGYFEPELRGAWRPDTVFRYPLYAPPRNLVSVDLGRFREEWKGRRVAGRVDGATVVPYATRAEIDHGALKGRQLELLWVDSAIDAFFLHIQGSGRVIMTDGTVVRVGYAARNGHRYTPIGRELVAQGHLPPDGVSMQSIRAWLKANPLAGRGIMERNKAYVFFRILDGDGPVGAQGVPLTPGRSLAVDTRHIPLGVPLWLDTLEPGEPPKPLRRVVVAQDTGSAIRGPVRGDVFFGFGADAGDKAGRMKAGGAYYLLLPKAVAR